MECEIGDRDIAKLVGSVRTREGPPEGVRLLMLHHMRGTRPNFPPADSEPGRGPRQTLLACYQDCVRLAQPVGRMLVRLRTADRTPAFGTRDRRCLQSACFDVPKIERVPCQEVGHPPERWLGT